jgi:hypothetical protein
MLLIHQIWLSKLKADGTTLCDKVYQWLATGWWFSRGTRVLTTNKSYNNDITEILLNVALNTKVLLILIADVIIRIWYDAFVSGIICISTWSESKELKSLGSSKPKDLKVVPYTSGKIWSARLIFLFFWQCVWINIKILTNSNQQTQSYKFTSHIAAFLSVVLITEMLEICIQTSYDQNVQLILKSYLPVVLGTTLTGYQKYDRVILRRWNLVLIIISLITL